jgi:radical SAM protein with 4Fe4S-binding SPASM domain
MPDRTRSEETLVAPNLEVLRTYAVWELTLKCNLACGHCGSRAGDKRDDELSTAEAMDLVRQMADLGISEVTLEGGEAYLRADWLDIARAITAAGMDCSMVTGGYGISRELARRMKDAGIKNVSVSVDGLAATHDHIRGRSGSFHRCFETFGHFRAVGIPFSANTQVNRLSAPEVPALYEHLRDAGVSAWQVQLTAPMGNAADRASWILQPAELDDVYRMLVRVALRARAERVNLAAANSIGYFGPYVDILRDPRGNRWVGCMAGIAGLGIHADGSVKGCPTLPSEYIGGNIRQTPLADIADSPELTFNMDAGTENGTAHLWGFCKTCPHAATCRGGCAQVATVLMGKRGNNPYCHHRALDHQARGLRERVVQRLIPIGKPFDHGDFRVVVEPADAPWPAHDALHFTYDKVGWPPGWEAWPIPDDADSRERAPMAR